MTLTELLKEIDQLRPNAERLEEEMPAQTRPGLMVAKRQAQDATEKLRNDYRRQVLTKVQLYFLSENESPAQVERFLVMASKLPGVVTVNSAGIYDGLAYATERAIGRDQRYLVSHCASLTGLLQQELAKLDFVDINAVPYRDGVVVRNHAEALKLVRETVLESNGHKPNVAFVTQKILAAAEEARFVGDRFVVVLYGIPDSEVVGFKMAFPTNTALNLQSLEKVNAQTVAQSLGVKVEQKKEKNTGE